MCIGESFEERAGGEAESVVRRQVDAVLRAAGIEGFANAVIAYEPVWAIGTGETARPDQAQSMHAFIRGVLMKFDTAIATNIKVLYGGSVKASNARELFAEQDRIKYLILRVVFF